MRTGNHKEKEIDSAEIETLYLNELKIQEVKSNQTIFKCVQWSFFTFFIVWVMTVLKIFIVDVSPMTLAFAITGVICLIVNLIYAFGDISKSYVKYIFLILVCVFCNAAYAILSVHAVLLYAVPLLFAAQYRNMKTLWFTYWFNALNMISSSLLAFHFGICDLNYMFHSNHTREWYLSHYNDGKLDILINENPHFGILFYGVFPKAIILMAFVVMLRYLLKSNMDDVVRIAYLTYGKDIDIPTKLYNKNKYSEMISSYYSSVDTVSVIYLDINNLKFVNDKYGHNMGNMLIDGMAAVLRKISTDQIRAFRAGGDEFVVIIDNPEESELARCTDRIKELISSTVLPRHIRLSAAIGTATGKGVDIERVIEASDESMYENKHLMKNNSKNRA